MKPLPALACLLLVAPATGCNVVMYPFARAFGGPSEAELKACRPAFDRLKAGFPAARLRVYPGRVPKGAGTELPGAADRLAEGLRAAGAAQCSIVSVQPALEPMESGHNQMRFTWKRARAYSDWVKQTRPEGDFFFFTDFLRGPDGVIHGMMLYVVEPTGQIAFVSLWNSHHFKNGVAPRDSQAACDLMVERFQRALKWEALRMFPPYGVG
jgi:hypothetical protein